MFKKKKREDDDSSDLIINDINQEDISDEEVSSIRDSLDSNVSESETKKFITGFRSNPPPKKSWWDKLEDDKKFKSGNMLVHKTEGRICKVCGPNTDPNTYLVKFSGNRDESSINGKHYKLAPDGTEYVPYMDEYTKWKYNRDLLKNIKP